MAKKEMFCSERVQTMLDFPRNVPDGVMSYMLHNVDRKRRLCSWLEPIGDDVMQRLFAFRHRAKDGLAYTEVIRRITGEKKYLFSNMYYTPMSGWVPVYDNKGVTRYYYGYADKKFRGEDFDKWIVCDDDQCRLENKIINLDVLAETRFKHCGYKYGCLMDYLNAYTDDSRVEFFGKIGIYPCKSLVAKAKKDRQFCAFLRNLPKKDDVETYGPAATIYAYDHHISIQEARHILYCKRSLDREMHANVPELKGTKIDRAKVRDYIHKLSGVEHEKCGMYNDYLKALKFLECDLTDTKNVFPRDFARMHDLRIAEYDSAKAKAEKESRDELFVRFAAVGEKLKCFEWQEGTFAAVIPLNVQDLVREGRELHHCVGKMGYDLKVANGDSVICFVRKLDEVEKPYVTVECDPKSFRIRQIHGDHNAAPDDATVSFVEAWVEHAKKISRAKRP